MGTTKEIHWIMNHFEQMMMGHLFEYLQEGGYTREEVMTAGNLIAMGVV